MNSKERVRLAFDHKNPDRVPCWFGSSDEFLEIIKTELGMSEEEVRQHLGDDFRVIRGMAQPSGGNEYDSQFDIERQGVGCGYATNHPLAELSSIEELDSFSWANPLDFKTDHIKELAASSSEYAVMSGTWSPFWHDAIDLVGHENLYYLMYDEPETVIELMKRLTDYYLSISERIFANAGDNIDIFFIGNDLGAQAGALLGVDLFNKFIAPSLRRLAELGHRYDCKVMLHSCGSIYDLIPSLIECGIDGLHALQPDTYSMEWSKLKSEFGSDIVLNGCIDSHHILINAKDTQEVTDKTRAVVEDMMKGGGYIASASHDTILPETPVQNVVAMFEAIHKYGKY